LENDQLSNRAFRRGYNRREREYPELVSSSILRRLQPATRCEIRQNIRERIIRSHPTGRT